jgi:hypothetical protein
VALTQLLTQEHLRLIPVLVGERLELILANQTAIREDISCGSEKILQQYELSLNTHLCLVIDSSPAVDGSKNGAMGKQIDRSRG